MRASGLLSEHPFIYRGVMARTQGSHSDITGPRIRKAALQLFARHGYAAVSMRQIAGEVGVQAGALYNYTPDKQSLLYSLMHQHMQELLSAYGELERSDLFLNRVLTGQFRYTYEAGKLARKEMVSSVLQMAQNLEMSLSKFDT